MTTAYLNDTRQPKTELDIYVEHVIVLKLFYTLSFYIKIVNMQ